MKAINLKQLSVDDLLSLRDRINALLENRVDRERRELEARLKRLHRFAQASAKPKESRSGKRGRPALAKKKARSQSVKKVAPKFRNPDNSAETWSGRGLQPRWMRAAIHGGKTMDELRI